MSNCEGFPSKEDLIVAQEAIDHISHVAKSKDAEGNKVLSVTNTIGDSVVTNKTLDGLTQVYLEAISRIGWVTIDSFEIGATLTNSSEVLRWESNGEYYRWEGIFPKIVPVDSTPESSGGIGVGAWLNIGDFNLRNDLKSYGIGLPNQATIQNFDWQYFEFTSGANYLMYQGNSLNNPPNLVIPPTSAGVSVTVDYITYSKVTGLTLIVIAGAPIVYKMLFTGVPGSRIFYVVQEWNSSGAIPISAGGTGATTAAEAIENLGGAMVIGIPYPYPLPTAPARCLNLNGSMFDPIRYPKLAVFYPSGILPDLRANVIRGADAGRGIDTGRALLSEQSDAIRNIVGAFSIYGVKEVTATYPSWGTGAFNVTGVTGRNGQESTGTNTIPQLNFSAANAGVPTAAENRMRNIAFNYIVRAE